jgi:hypothetical protein
MPHDPEQKRLAGQKSRSHGVYALRDRGPESLEPAQRSRYQELREMVKSQPGREEFREELLATVMMIVDLGVGELRQASELGQGIWTTPIIKSLASYVNSAARLIDSFPINDMKSVRMTQVIEEMKERAEAMEHREAEKQKARDSQEDTASQQDASGSRLEPEPPAELSEVS